MIGRKESQRCYFIELIKEAATNSFTPFFVKAKNCVTNQKKISRCQGLGREKRATAYLIINRFYF